MNLERGRKRFQRRRLRRNPTASRSKLAVEQPEYHPKGPRIRSEEPHLTGRVVVGLKRLNPPPLSFMNFSKSRSQYCPVPKPKLFEPTLYKSYCEGSFTRGPKNVNGPRRNRVLTIGAVCGEACARAQVAVESTHR